MSLASDLQAGDKIAWAVVGLVGLVIVAQLYVSAKNLPSTATSAGQQLGQSAANLVGGVLDGVWNGDGTGPLDSWSNFANYLTGGGSSAN